MADKMLENNEQARRNAREIYDLARKITAEIHAEHHQPAVRFTLEPGEPGIFESKAGGTPYLPHDMPWPLDSRGQGMNLLAQVDCSGLGGLPDFPQSGLLQFFTGLDDLFGAEFDHMTEQKDFRVLYHEVVDPSVTAEEVGAKRPPLPEDEDVRFYTPLCSGPCRILLQAPIEQGMNESAPLFDPLFTEKWNQARPELRVEYQWKIHELVAQRLRDYDATEQPGWKGPYHQLGGYPFFTQQDPRPGECDDLDVLLFQLDSDMPKGGKDLILWGDSGVGNFFINREALRRRDFSRVAYTWDCC